MDSGWAGFLGAVAGAAATLGGVILTDCLNSRRQARKDKPRKELLKRMLEKGFGWRSLSTLSNVTGVDEDEAKRLLVEIGARGSETDPSLWGLISRNPLPEHDPQDQ